MKIMENKNIIDLKNLKFGKEGCIKITPHELLEINESFTQLQEQFRKEREDKIKLLVAILDCWRLYSDNSDIYFNDRKLEEKLKAMYPEELEDRKQQLLEEKQKKEDEQ